MELPITYELGEGTGWKSSALAGWLAEGRKEGRKEGRMMLRSEAEGRFLPFLTASLTLTWWDWDEIGDDDLMTDSTFDAILRRISRRMAANKERKTKSKSPQKLGRPSHPLIDRLTPKESPSPFPQSKLQNHNPNLSSSVFCGSIFDSAMNSFFLRFSINFRGASHQPKSHHIERLRFDGAKICARRELLQATQVSVIFVFWFWILILKGRLVSQWGELWGCEIGWIGSVVGVFGWIS